MLKNSIRSLMIYFLTIIICIIIMFQYYPSFTDAMIVYGDSHILLIVSSILFVFGGFFLEVQKSIKRDFISLILLTMLFTLFLVVLSIDYDYVISIYEQNTVSLKVFSVELLDTIYMFCTPLSWFIGVPAVNKDISKFIIVLFGVYPTIMFFIGLELKRIIYYNKKRG